MANIKQTVDLTQGTLSNLIVEDGKLKLPNVNAPTFTRNSIAYKSDGSQVAANQPRFDVIDGVMGLMVEEGTTNVCTNGSFESNLTGWTFPLGQYERTSQEKYFGSYSLKLTNPDSSTTAQAWFSVPNPSSYAGKTVTVTVYAKTDRPYHGRLEIREYDGSTYRWIQSNWHSGSGQWEKLTLTMTFRDTVTDIQIQLMNRVNHGDNTPTSVYFDGVQFEEKPYATSFIDGTRSPEILTIPTAGVLNPQEGTVECWVYVNDVVRRNITNNWSTVVLIRKGSYVANWIWIEHNFGGDWALQIRKEDGTITGQGDFSDSLTPDGWHYFAVRWNAQAGTADLFHNGVKRVSLIGVAFPAEYDRIEVGHRSGGSGDWLNSLIDDLRISNRARTDAEILSAYQSNQPLPIDENTTYALRFDGGLNFGRGGYYISPEYDLSTVGNYVKHRVYWQEDADKEECLVYAKLDNQFDWTQLTNGGSLPIVEGQDLTGRKIQFKVKLLDLV